MHLNESISRKKIASWAKSALSLSLVLYFSLVDRPGSFPRKVHGRSEQGVKSVASWKALECCCTNLLEFPMRENFIYRPVGKLFLR